MNYSTQKSPDKNYCLNCGHPNPLWAVTCEKCYKKLNPVDGVDFSKVRINRSRPGCVTAYAVFLFFGAGTMALAGVIFALLFFGNTNGASSIWTRMGFAPLGAPGTIGISLILGLTMLFIIFYIVIGWGLWNLKNWARILVIGLHSLGLCSALYSIFSVIFNFANKGAGSPMVSISGGLFNLIVAGIIIYWFSTNGDYFN